MTATCPVHKTEMKLIPAGTSKRTGKPYKAFYACTSYNCRETAPATNEVEQEVEKQEPDLKAIKESNRDWLEEDNEIEKGEPMTKEEKMWRDKEDRAAQREDKRNAEIRRMTLAKQYIGASVDFDTAVENGDLLKWDQWTKTGNLPGPHGEED